MKGSRTAQQLLGEALREMGVLIVVFYGLSVVIKPALTWMELASAVVALPLGIGIWLIGVNLEPE